MWQAGSPGLPTENKVLFVVLFVAERMPMSGLLRMPAPSACSECLIGCSECPLLAMPCASRTLPSAPPHSARLPADGTDAACPLAPAARRAISWRTCRWRSPALGRIRLSWVQEQMPAPAQRAVADGSSLHTCCGPHPALPGVWQASCAPCSAPCECMSSRAPFGGITMKCPWPARACSCGRGALGVRPEGQCASTH